MKFLKPLVCLVTLLSFQFSFAQLRFSVSEIVFSNNISPNTDSASVYFVNTTTETIEITDVNLFHKVFIVSDTAFSIPALDSILVKVYVSSKHNIDYQDYLYVVLANNEGYFSIPVFAKVNYANAYYNATQNKWHEQLKTALKTITGAGYTNLGYNGARDRMYMDIDNEKVNGQGSAQNRLECVYTGREAVNYTSRTDCQTNFAFNTEHTFPQGFFNQVEPERADLHHLFPTDDATNNARGNSPFGVVSNPTGSNGGSKWTSTLFEPRNVQKGKSARAMLYFVTRYQDYSNYLAQNETLMRNWCLTYLPDSIEIRRNNDVFTYQKNRNPYIDYPQFLERIASISSSNNGTFASKLYLSGNSLNFDTTSLSGKILNVYISNQGNADLTISNLAFSTSDFSLANTISTIINPDSVIQLAIQFSPSAVGNYTAELTFNTNDATNASKTIYLNASAQILSAKNISEDKNKFELSPNPFNDEIILNSRIEQMVKIYSIFGQEIKTISLHKGENYINTEDMREGVYVVQSANFQTKIIKLK